MVAKHPIPDAALDDRLAFIGTTGSGKTYNAGSAVERVLDKGARCVIVDPLDVWYGLRLQADGKKASPYPVVIFGGTHGDLSLNEHAGKLIGETVATMSESCIVSLGGLPTKSAERRFMLAFLETLYRQASGEPFHLIFDEADLWAPQKASEPMLQNLMEQIVRRGRVKGFIPWLITQRPAVISKDVLSQVDGLVAFKLTASQDRDALGAWIEGQADKQQGKDILASLPAMQRGQGVVWVPGRGILDTATFPPKRTFDSSRTPKRGEKVRSATLAPIDIGKLKERLATVEAETKANDPARLRNRIAELEALLRKAPAAATPLDVRAIETAAFGAGKVAGYESGLAVARNLLDRLNDVASRAHAHAAAVQAALDKDPPPAPVAKAPARAPMQRPTTQYTTVRPAPAAASPRAEGVTGVQQRILDALAELRAIGANDPPRILVANLAGYGHVQSKGFVNALSSASTAGLVEYGRGGSVRLTDAGLAAAAPVDAALTDDALHERIKAHLSGPGARILDALIAAYPGGIARSELAGQVGYGHVQSKGFVNSLSRLRTMGFIDYRQGDVVALPVLFVGGNA